MGKGWNRGKEGKALHGVDRHGNSAAMNSLKQRVEQDDETYNNMGTGTALATPKETGTKEKLVGRLDKDELNGQKVDQKGGEDSVEEEEGEGKECGVAKSTKVQDSNL